ncbi:MAG: helix-turn-helix transcriptional regulator [Atribacterota bacterium]|jgi:MerR family transcriptional regulator/heat shock protein HspR|nr:helix-turn-helix transcriptional regulator [Atribacterota bacterium]
MVKNNQKDEYFIISVVAQMTHLHPQTLRYYEKMGILRPNRSQGNIRLYSYQDVERVRQIKALTQDMGVNLAGVEIILRLTEQIEAIQGQWEKEREKMRNRIKDLEGRISKGGEILL